ncbi:hypothetical protein PH586_18765 [Pseudomonas sp. SA3-5]|uniref:DUF4145 domain-containing protein n=1 Tax=Pseudomonas aestuarii TaxID=3018340 RepID=A0ABT4XJS2_9PSED|nr:hypothetical protein [Pseudomonas aestuarii]MDA7088427.1 hypothetical protein [Pseudomonas aestuarii]
MVLDLRNLITRNTFSRKEKVLLLLAHEHEQETSVARIKELAIQSGLREISKWNISQLLSDLGELATRLPNGWIITNAGLDHLESIGILKSRPAKETQATLREYSSKISSTSTKAFVEEGIEALELGLFRSAVVLSWIGAISILYEKVIADHLKNFNAEALNRNPRWKEAKTSDDLSKMKEFDFLQIIVAISIIGKNTKDELEQCLKLRNTCGHPNSHAIGEHRVTSHMETLILNVFSRF